MSARIAPGRFRDTGPLIWAFSRIAGRVTGTGPPAVFTTLGRGRGLFWGWLHFAARLMPGGKLPRRETELVIIKVALLRGSDYEFEHHVRLGRRAGVTDADIERIRGGADAEGWSAEEAMLMRVTEELVSTRDLAEETWRLVTGRYSERVIIELLLLIGHYDMLATTLTTLRLEPDSPR